MKALKWVGAKIADNIAGVVITAIGGSLLVFLTSAREYAGELGDWLIAPVEVSRWLLILFVTLIAAVALLLISALIVKAFKSEPPAWKNYREDTFEGALWRWDYTANNIANVQAYCLNCDCALELLRDRWSEHMHLECVSCKASHECFHGCNWPIEVEGRLKKLIGQRVRQKYHQGNREVG